MPIIIRAAWGKDVGMQKTDANASPSLDESEASVWLLALRGLREGTAVPGFIASTVEQRCGVAHGRPTLQITCFAGYTQQCQPHSSVGQGGCPLRIGKTGGASTWCHKQGNGGACEVHFRKISFWRKVIMCVGMKWFTIVMDRPQMNAKMWIESEAFSSFHALVLEVEEETAKMAASSCAPVSNMESAAEGAKYESPGETEIGGGGFSCFRFKSGVDILASEVSFVLGQTDGVFNLLANNERSGRNALHPL